MLRWHMRERYDTNPFCIFVGIVATLQENMCTHTHTQLTKQTWMSKRKGTQVSKKCRWNTLNGKRKSQIMIFNVCVRFCISVPNCIYECVCVCVCDRKCGGGVESERFVAHTFILTSVHIIIIKSHIDCFASQVVANICTKIVFYFNKQTILETNNQNG